MCILIREIEYPKVWSVLQQNRNQRISVGKCMNNLKKKSSYCIIFKVTLTKQKYKITTTKILKKLFCRVFQNTIQIQLYIIYKYLQAYISN